MSIVFAIDTSTTAFTPAVGTPAPGSPVWVTVRPAVRRGAAVAADLLAGLGKDLTWHGKGRNESEDVRLAQAWITAMQVSALVVANAQEAPLPTLDTLRSIARSCDVDLWLLYRAPVDDRTHRKITKMATRSATVAEVPTAVLAEPSEPLTTGPVVEVLACDFPTFRTTMLRGGDRYAPGLAAYEGELRRTSSDLTQVADMRAGITSAAVRILRNAPGDGELVARLRALQVIAWRRDHLLSVDVNALLASVERPRHAGDALDQALLAYRQPQRAIVAALTLRGIHLDGIDALTVNDAGPDGSLHGIDVPNPTPDLNLAVIAQRHLRTLEGAQPGDRLLAPDGKTLARFVNDASADLGINIAGRRVERELNHSTWLKRLGITIKAL